MNNKSNKELARIRKKYTRVVKMGKVYNTYLQIDHQGFQIVGSDTKYRAEWFAKMLSIALQRLIAANSKSL